MGASIADTELDDDSDFAETHEINVTPFIDVILVLLIIFMVAAPLGTVDLPIDLPASTATLQKKPDMPTYVSIKPELDTEPRPSRRLWILAAVGALALHVGGGALAVAHLRTDDLDDSLGAPAIEIGLELMSPRLEASDLPPGPDTDASVASPALAEQKAELKETELPKAVPTEADDPDRVVTPKDSNKPKEEDSKIAAVQTTAATESVAAEAT